MPIVWRRKRDIWREFSDIWIALLSLGIGMLLLVWVGERMFFERKEALSQTFPVFASSFLFVVSLYRFRKGRLILLDAKGKRKIMLGLMALPSDVHVLYDVDLMHRGVSRRVHFLIISDKGIVLLHADNHADSFVQTEEGKVVRLGRLRPPEESAVLLECRGRVELVESILKDAGVSLEVKGYAVFPNNQGVVALNEGEGILPMEELVRVNSGWKQDIGFINPEEVTKKVMSYASSRHFRS